MRNHSLDALRFAAIFAVVLQHGLRLSAGAGMPSALATLALTMWAVPLLFALSGYLSTFGGRVGAIDRRLRRLIIPYAFWSVALLVYTAQGAMRAGVTLTPNWLGVVLAGQAFFTLWFLAMLMYVAIVGWALRSARSRLIGAGVAAITYAAIAVARAGLPALGPDTWAGFLIIAPLCVATYLAGAALPSISRPVAMWVPNVIAGGAVLADIVMYLRWGYVLTQGQQSAILSAGAVASLAIISAVPARTHLESGLMRFVAWSGTYALGIFVLHAPILNTVRYLTHTRDSASFAWALGVSVLGTVLSLGACIAISRVRPLRGLVR